MVDYCWKGLCPVLGVCMSSGYSCVVLCTVVMYLSSRFFNQLLLSRLWLVIVSLVFLNFVTTVFLSIFLYWYSHSCNNEKSKFVKKLFVNLITVAVFYCRYVIDKDIVESFCSLSLSLYIYIYMHIYIFIYIYTSLSLYIYTNCECLLYQCHTYINKLRRHILQISNISILTNL